MARPFDNLTPALTRLGPPPGEARREVLFIHGAWGGAWVWEGLAEPVAQAGYGVNLIEMPGHGGDRWELPASTSIADYADLSRRAAASLGRPVLVGHSLGGWQVQKIWEAVDLPGALVAPLPASGLPLGSLLRLQARYPGPMLRPLLGLPVGIRDRAMARRLLFRSLPDAQVDARLARLVSEPARVTLDMALGLVRARPRPGREPRLLLAPERDYLFPVATQRRLARRLGARLELLPGLPHEPWTEDKQGLVLGLLLGFLKGL